MIKKGSCDIIIAVAINVGARDTSLNQILIPELVHIGMSGSVPIIPSIIQAESLLELNALAPQYCESWSRSVDEISHDTVVEEVTEVSDIVLDIKGHELVEAVAAVHVAEPHIALQQSPSGAKKGGAAAGQRIVGHNFLVSLLLLRYYEKCMIYKCIYLYLIVGNGFNTF